MPIGSGRVGGIGVKAIPGIKGPHKGIGWRSPALSQVTQVSASRIFDATSGVRPTAFVDSRSSTGYYFNSSGVLVSAASNTERIDYDPNTLAVRGLLVEPADTELVFHSLLPDDAAWTDNGISTHAGGVTDLQGTTHGVTITAGTGSSRQYILEVTGGSSLTNGTTYSQRWFLKQGTSPYTIFGDANGNAWQWCTIKWSDLSVTTNGTDSAIVSTPVSLGNGVYQIDVTWTRDLSGTAIPAVGPSNVAASTLGNNNSIWTGTGTETSIFLGVQFRLGSVVTSPIPTTTAAVTRSGDVPTFTLNSAATQLIFTFDDNTTQTITGLTGGSTYTIPTNLNRAWIKYIDDNTGTVTGVSAALAATEAADTAAFVVTETINAALAATEVADTAAIAVSVGDNAALAATEAQDVALINATETDVAVLSATEAQDTAAIVVQVKDNAALATTEAQDVAAINASIGDNAALAATEVKDVALINASGSDVAVLAATEAADVSAFVVTETDNAALAATESRDVAAFVVTEGDNVALAATEAKDVAAFGITVGAAIAVLAVTENQDVARFSVAVTEIVIPPDPRPSHGLRRIYPAAGVPGVYGADIFGSGSPATTPDFSSGDFSGDFARTGTPATAGSGASIYGAAGALNKPLRRTTGPQMRRTYKYPVQLIPGGIYDKDIYGQNIYQSDS